MFEYGNLKYIKDKGWYFIYKKDKYIDFEFGEEYFLDVLNDLGVDGWELVSIDNTLGLVLKREVLYE